MCSQSWIAMRNGSLLRRGSLMLYLLVERQRWPQITLESNSRAREREGKFERKRRELNLGFSLF